MGQNNGAEQQVVERAENGNGYRWHCFDGQFHRLPKDWRFPCVGVFDIWKHWWIGDSVHGVPPPPPPPLRMLSAEDMKFWITFRYHKKSYMQGWVPTGTGSDFQEKHFVISSF